MFQMNHLSRRISKSIRHRVARLIEESPDGPIAMYAWLWQSIGKRSGPTMIPRSIRFSFLASLDLISAGAWWVQTRALRTSRSVLRWTGVVALAIVLGVSPALQVRGQDQDVEENLGFGTRIR